MKTRVARRAGVVLAVAVLLFSGCGKHSVAVNRVAAVAKPVKANAPYRNVTGYTALITEINNFSIRRITHCPGSSVTSVSTHVALCNELGSPFNFSSVQTLTPTEQDNVMKAALAWAAEHEPDDYFVSAISYNDDIIAGGSPSYSGIDIVVTYRKCTGG